MKLLILTIAFMTLTTCLKPINAVEVNFKSLVDHASQGEFRLEQWEGIELKFKQDDFYYFASYETAKATIAAPMFDYNIYGAGFGFDNKLTDKFRVYGQAGYYVPDTSLKGRFKCVNYSCGEGLYYGLNQKWAGLHSNGLVQFDEFEVNTKGGYGITFGGEMTHNVSKSINLVIGVEYRVLDITTEIHGMSPVFGDYDVNGQRWETQYKGISSTNYKVGLEYKF